MTPNPSSTANLQVILVATDGSPDATYAATIAADLAQRSGAALHLAHTWQPIPVATYPDLGMVPPTTYQLYQDEAETILNAAAEALASGGVRPAATHLRSGPAVSSIVAIAEEIGADLIVIGSRGLGPLRRLILGSVSSGLAHETTRPVLIARGGQGWPPERIIVGDDGTAAAQRPIDLAAALARLYTRPVALVHACPVPHDSERESEEILRRSVGMAPSGDDRVATLREELFHHAAGILNERVIALQAAGQLDVTPEIVFAEPATAIVGAAEGAGGPALIVVGSRGLGAMARLRLGSVSTKVLHAATDSVLIVPQR